MKNSKQSQDTLVRERPPFTMLEDSILDDERISRQALLVYWVLCRHINREGECWPGFARIAKMARYSRRAVIDAIEELVVCGYIVKEVRTKEGDPKTHLSNKYKILKQYDYQKTQQPYQGGKATAPGVVQPLHQGSATTAPELDPLNKINKEEGSSPSSSLNSPEKKPSLYERFEAIRKQRFKATDDLETQFSKHTKEFDALNADEKDELLTAYEKYINDFSDKWVNDIGHTFAYFWKKRDKWYAAPDPRAEKDRELGKLSKEYHEVRREITRICKDEKAFPGLSAEEQQKQRAAAPGRKLPWETERKAKLMSYALSIGRRLNELPYGWHICSSCGEEFQGQMCQCGFMEAAA